MKFRQCEKFWGFSIGIDIEKSVTICSPSRPCRLSHMAAKWRTHTHYLYKTRITCHESSRRQFKAPFLWHCGHVLTLISYKIYTSNFGIEKQHYASPAANLNSPSVITFSTERPRMLVPRSFIPQNAPTESCRCTTRIPWYHQNPVVPLESGGDPQNPVCTYSVM